MQFLERLTRDHPEIRVRMLTFTRAATAEFAHKMGDAELQGLGIAPPSTVHAFALSLLMRTPGVHLPIPLRIPDSWEAKRLIRPQLSRLLRRDGHQLATPSVVEALEREMSAGWESMDPEKELYSALDPALGAAYAGTWASHRWALGYVLLGELPYQAGRALEDHGPGAVDLDLLLVDEYQDLNEADIHLVRLVASNGVSVLAIGDDDQSIYGYRMAAPRGILRFLDEFGTDCDYELSESRRCGGAILSAAATLIASAPGRPAKKPLRAADDAPDGCFGHLRFAGQAAELAGVAKIVALRREAGVPLNEIAILVRSNQSVWAGLLEPELTKFGIPLASTDWVQQVLGEPHVRRAIALAHLAIDRHDSLGWMALLHLTTHVGPGFLDYVYDRIASEESFGTTLIRLRQEHFPGAPPSGVGPASAVIDETLMLLEELDVEGAELDERGWAGWLMDRSDSAGFSDDATSLFHLVGANVAPSEGLAGFLANLEPVGRDLAASLADAVRLMSITQSKGLTVNTAIVMGVEEGQIPMPPPKGEINEERRLLYVAMTRATEMCILTSAAQRTGPTARFGAPRVRQSRGRCPLLADLPGGIGLPQAGAEWIERLEFSRGSGQSAQR